MRASMGKVTYKDAGVDLEVYDEAMTRLPRLMHRTFSPRVMKLDGGFAGLFQLDFASKMFARNYQEPVLVSCTDGVGTKIKIALAVDRRRATIPLSPSHGSTAWISAVLSSKPNWRRLWGFGTSSAKVMERLLTI